MVSDFKWFCEGSSVTGALHLKKGLPNQDAIKWNTPESKDNDLPIILAVSDGHGSSKYFRSEIGSKLAVDAAIEVIKERILENEQYCGENCLKHLKELEQEIQERLPKRIIKRWQELVQEDLQTHPAEVEAGLKQLDDKERQKVEFQPRLAYGATLLCVVVTKHFILYLQLGDGDILYVDSQRNTIRAISLDKKLIANETTSLCMEEAWKEFHSKLETYSQDELEQVPELILVATDGYANSFASEADFLLIGKDYQQIIIEQGLDRFKEQLPNFLEQTSAQGSGDDISLGVITRINAQTNNNSEPETETLESQEVNESIDNQENIELTDSTVSEKIVEQEKESLSSDRPE